MHSYLAQIPEAEAQEAQSETMPLSLRGPKGLAMWSPKCYDVILRFNWRKGKKMSKVCRKESMGTVGPGQSPKLQGRAISTFMRRGKLRAQWVQWKWLGGSDHRGSCLGSNHTWLRPVSGITILCPASWNQWSFYLETSAARKRAEKNKLGLTSFLRRVKEKFYKQLTSTEC